MTPIVAAHPSDAGHWYSRAGEPMYDIEGKNGGVRPTTLADARKLALVPSVTTIIRCAAAPGLERWKQEQVLLSALTLGRQAVESETDWVARVFRDSQEQGRAAADRGTEIHAEIERYFGAPGNYEPSEVVAAVERAIVERFPITSPWYTEESFAHPSGFGGKVDLNGYEPGVLLDIKTKDNWPQNYPPRGFDEHVIQLAAYRVGLGRESAMCANVFVSRQEPWQVHIQTWTEDELQRGWRCFKALLDFWAAKNNYEPAFAVEGPF